mgnify:CR=1 FL=1|tara:strand:+ start:736 stop:2391 length:1656 start_codon:yes stop_codon:yes gene_type:complete
MEKLDIDLLVESANNPRQIRDEEVDKELMENIKQRGQLMPLLVRKEGKKYRIIAGHRRYGALKALGTKEVDVKVTDVSKKEADELMVIDNLQRADVHPMEEARAFQDMYDELRKTTLPEACLRHISKKVGKSVSYITQNIKLASLTNEVAQQFLKNVIDKKIALEYAKLTHEDQKSVWSAKFLNWSETPHHSTLTDLKRYIDQFKTNAMSEITWDIDDEDFVGIPVKGKEKIESDWGVDKLPACSKCPKNTGVNTNLFGTVLDENARCRDKVCFNHKKRKQASKKRADAKASLPFPYDFHEGSIETDWNDNQTVKISGGSIKAEKIKGQSLEFKTKVNGKFKAPVFIKAHNMGWRDDKSESLLHTTVYIDYPEPNPEVKKSKENDTEDYEARVKAAALKRRSEQLMLNHAIFAKKDFAVSDNYTVQLANIIFDTKGWSDQFLILALYESYADSESFKIRLHDLREMEVDDLDAEYNKLISSIDTLEKLQKLLFVCNSIRDLSSTYDNGTYTKDNSIRFFISKICGLDFKEVTRAVSKEAKQWYREEKEEDN